MPVKTSILFVLLAVLAFEPAAAELLTLFTTPDERQLINRNRYKSAEPVAQSTPEPDRIPETPAQQIIREEITLEYLISGITISNSGPHTVWINSVAYEDGARLEDDSAIRVIVGDEIRVRITAPDGKHYYAASGESLEITYMAAVGLAL